MCNPRHAAPEPDPPDTAYATGPGASRSHCGTGCVREPCRPRARSRAVRVRRCPRAQLTGCLTALPLARGNFVARASSPSAAALAVPGCTGACACRRAGSGARCRRVEAGGARGRGAAPGLEHLARHRASAGHHHLRRLPAPLSHRVGPWMAGRGRVLRFGAASSRARYGGVERRATHRAPAPGGVPEPLPHPYRPAMCWGGCCAGWRRTSRPAIATARGWWRPSSRAHEGASFRRRLRGVGPTGDVGAATAPMTVPARSVPAR